MSSRKSTIDWPRVLLSVCRTIESADAMPGLDDLAAESSVSPSELQRQFSRRLGASPKAYVQALQLQRLTRGAGHSANALDAVLDAGFQSASAAYAQSRASLGVPPGKIRRAIAVGWWLGLSDLGWMLMAATPQGICWLSFGDEPDGLREELYAAFPRADFYNDEDRLRDWFEQVREYILLPRGALDLPVDIQGTAFQALVWKTLRKIPLGDSLSYSRVAQTIGKPTAVRAVASACGSNKIAVLIPCHRVVGADGSLAGYRWGLERKGRLLEREGCTVGAQQ